MQNRAIVSRCQKEGWSKGSKWSRSWKPGAKVGTVVLSRYIKE